MTCLRPTLALLAFLALPLSACGGSVVIPSETDGGVDADTGGCSSTDCGPAPGIPSEPCWDGTYGGAVCARNSSGVCGWQFRGCPPAKSCAGIPGECGGTNLYCKRTVGACGGTGTCALKPETCDLLYAPVCGCDGKTYGNACAAQMAGMTVAREGECATPSTCTTNGECGAGLYCKMADGMCGATGPGPKPVGTCAPRPSGCPDSYDPVCGCDGTTYSNRCDAAAVGVNVQFKGPCTDPPPPAKICGGFAGAVCATWEFCDYPVAAMCGAADGTGLCKPRPVGCTKELAPVCGCDGKTYDNACLAHAAGQDDRYPGVCGK